MSRHRPGPRPTAALVVSFSLAIGCGAGSSSAGNGDGGGNPPDCPAVAPTDGSPCSPSKLQCGYGCNVTATCVGSAWSIVESNIRCAGDAGPSDGATTCHSNNDCSMAYSCSPGGASVGCGICEMPQNPCSADSDCAVIHDAAPPQPMVCGPGGPCVCNANGKTGDCIPACKTATDCGADETCDPSGHCVTKSCSSDADCTSTQTVDYACSGNLCQPKACTTDADCGAHFCVNKVCYPQPGICTPPAS
jgi:hypothetical protein